MALTIYILEDDETFRSSFVPVLNKQLPGEHEYRLLTFSTGPEMLRSAEALPPDLLFADIALEGDTRTGIDYMAALGKIAPGCEVIYLTSFLDFATDIFETRPLYFIVKSQYINRLPDALKLFFRCYVEKHRVIRVTSGGIPVTIKTDDIQYCEHLSKNTIIHCADSFYPVRCTLTELFAMLPRDGFSICHRSFIVGHAYVRSYTRTSILLTTGQELPVGRSSCDEFRTRYSRWLGGQI